MLVAVACTPGGTIDPPTSSTVAPTLSTPSTTIDPANPPTTLPRSDQSEILPPNRGEAVAVARGVLVPVDGFWSVEDPQQYAEDLVFALKSWVPEDLIAGTASAVYEDEAGTSIAVVSVIPSLVWRGDPGFVADLIQVFTGNQLVSPADGIFTVVAASGVVIQMWSTGDGFVAAASPEDNAAVAYLVGLAEIRGPNDVWSTGTCLYLEDAEDLPYAPFPQDIVVPCEGSHNAEVLLGTKAGTDLETYDADAIEYERNYACDRAYSKTFGSQRTQTPSLVTYMPDAAEWERGDRYLACLVTINTNIGRELVAGPMTELDNLTWAPKVGDCVIRGLPAETTNCQGAHAYQYLGDGTVEADTWPGGADTAFRDACAPLLDALSNGPGDLRVLPIGLGPYTFEQGDRTVRCMAFATSNEILIDVIGRFDETWRLLGEGGLAA